MSRIAQPQLREIAMSVVEMPMVVWGVVGAMGVFLAVLGITAWIAR
jgi:hypothetical protein